MLSAILSTLSTNHCLVCICAQVIRQPWLALLTKTWLTAWHSFWLPWCLFLLPVQWRLSTSFVLKKTIWAGHISAMAPVWVALTLTISPWVITWEQRMGTMKMIRILKHFDFSVFKTFLSLLFHFSFIFVFLNSLNPTAIFLTIVLDK